MDPASGIGTTRSPARNVGATTPCPWCGLLTEAGPACRICGSPVLDIGDQMTVVRVGTPTLQEGAAPSLPWSLPEPARRDLQPQVGDLPAMWIGMGEAATFTGVAEPIFRRWVGGRLEDPVATGSDPGEPQFLLVDRSALREDDLLWAMRGRSEALPPARPDAGAAVIDTRTFVDEGSLTPVPRQAPLASTRAAFVLTDTWAFAPIEGDRRWRNRRSVVGVGVVLGAAGAAKVAWVLLHNAR